MAYWDTSCLLKLYVTEPDSPVFTAYILAGATVVTSVIARLELWATLRRKESEGSLPAGAAKQAMSVYDADVSAGLIRADPLSDAIIALFEVAIEKAYAMTPPVRLRTLDAIHLATAQAAAEFEIVATDLRLRDAASRLGLNVYPPP
jgi:predicted nucleic acid-binding protein